MLVALASTAIYFSGVSALNSANDPHKEEVRISTESLSVVESENPNVIHAMESSSFADPAVYSAGLGSIGDFFAVKVLINRRLPLQVCR